MLTTDVLNYGKKGSVHLMFKSLTVLIPSYFRNFHIKVTKDVFILLNTLM